MPNPGPNDDRATKEKRLCDSILVTKLTSKFIIHNLQPIIFHLGTKHDEEKNCLWRHLIHFIYLMQIEWVNYSFSTRFIIRLLGKNGFCHWNRYDMVCTETERAIRRCTGIWCGIHINIYAKRDEKKKNKMPSLSIPKISKELNFKVVVAVVIQPGSSPGRWQLTFSHWTTIIIIIDKDIETTHRLHYNSFQKWLDELELRNVKRKRQKNWSKQINYLNFNIYIYT